MGRDAAWRRAAAAALEAPASGRLLDLCAGTADLALELARLGPASIVCADFSLGMLARGRAKAAKRRPACPLRFVAADAMALPFRDGSFDGAGVAFGVRNFADRAKGLGELARVLAPGAPLVVLEFARPPKTLAGRVGRRFLLSVLPKIGDGISRNPDRAYAYLSATIRNFPAPPEFAAILEAAGFADVRWKTRMGGFVAIHRALRRAAP
jgi:demethylmenaquinone methyltransferase/2-methoxy-6-polyprenyl-1,4-benzoquinol methylase